LQRSAMNYDKKTFDFTVHKMHSLLTYLNENIVCSMRSLFASI